MGSRNISLSGVARILRVVINNRRISELSPGARGKIRKVDIPSQFRDEFGEGMVQDPNATEDVDVVGESGPDSFLVNYRGKQIPVQKSLVNSEEPNG